METLSTQTDKTMGILAWGLGAVPGLGFLPAMVIYLVMDESSDERRFNREVARKALNWQLTAFIVYIIGFATLFILVGIVILILIQLINTIFCIVGGIKTSQNMSWDAPYTLEMVK